MAELPWAFLAFPDGTCEFFRHNAAKTAYPFMLLFWEQGYKRMYGRTACIDKDFG